MNKLLRVFLGAAILVAAAAAQASFNFTVTAPTEGSFIGLSNQLQFNVHLATVQVTIRVQVDGPGSSNTITQQFTPDASGNINGSIPLNFSLSSPQGAYTLTVTASDPGFTAPVVILHVTLDVIAPKILEFNPNINSFVKGPIVPIVVKVQEANIKEWRVQINNQDIPNNTGTTLDGNGMFTVNWDTTGILTDGAQTITITVKDKAQNLTTQNISVTLDRIPPLVTISFPRSDTHVRPHSTFSVVIDVQDASSSSVDVSGIDVILKTMSGAFIYRVPRVSFQGVSGTTMRWTGRVRAAVNLPTTFKILVTCRDKAGNLAVPQEATITVGN